MNILETKLDEYSEFPALVLGLDGWILKSVPTETRPQFLRSYQKTLQIAFHPDRAPNDVAKLSREKFLQVVGEAVAYLSENQINYELATDNVPTKRNPLVALRRGTEARDELIERKHQELESTKIRVRELETKLEEASMNNARIMSAAQQEQYAHYRMRAWLNSNVKEMAPILGQHIKFHGEHVTMAVLAHRTYENTNLKTAAPQPMLLRAGKVRGCSVDGARVIGAMANTHLVDYIRSQRNWQEPNRNDWPNFLEDATADKLRFFMVPFIAPAVALILDTLPMSAIIVARINAKSRQLSDLDAELKLARQKQSVAETENRKLKRKVKRLTDQIWNANKKKKS
jgi:hypothetical protein